MDEDLRVRLWNVIKTNVLDHLTKWDEYGRPSDIYKDFTQGLAYDFKIPIDSMPAPSGMDHFIREKFFKFEWNEVYDFIENLSDFLFAIGSYDDYDFEFSVNGVLESEFSGYRFIKGDFVPISNDLELREVEKAISETESYTGLRGANIHLSKALKKLSDRDSPDYSNSIKESICAVETVCRIITDESTLGKALNKIETLGIKLNSQFKVGLEKMYSYTNSKENGIRHAIIDEHSSPDFEDAKYMLIICSAFINYLVGKCSAYGIEIPNQ